MSTLNKNNKTILGYDLPYWDGGQGDVVLLLSGAGGPEIMLDAAETLAQSYRVILPEHPGFGSSETPDWLERVPDLAQFYRRFVAELDVGPVHVVGHSFGGWAAAEMAVRDTRWLTSLTLVAAGGIKIKGAPIADNFLWDREKTIRNFFVNAELAEKALSRPMDDNAMFLMLKRQETVARMVWRPRWHNPDLQKWLHIIDIPTMIIWGDKDCLFPVEYANEYAARIQHAQCKIISQCGHLPFIEMKDQFIDTLTSFLKEI